MTRIRLALVVLTVLVSGWLVTPVTAQTQVWHWVNGVLRGPGFISAGPVLNGDGSASAPSYSFTSDPDTGFHRNSGANTIGVAAGGSNIGLWSSTGVFANGLFLDIANQDVALSRGTANRLDLASGDSFRLVLGTTEYANANGQLFSNIQQLTELTTINAAANTDTTIQMPAGAVILAVSTRVTVVIPTAATFTVGDSGSAARFNTGATVSAAANTTDAGTKAGAYYNASALSVRITPNATPGANTGRVRVTIYYYSVTPPTS